MQTAKKALTCCKGRETQTANVDVYSNFVKDSDTVVVGWNAYRQIATQLSPSEWVYSNFKTYAITHGKYVSSENRINQYYIPTLLDTGIRLFGKTKSERKLRLLKT